MRYHRLRRMLRVRDWTKTAASLLVLASEALFTTFVLYALNGYDQTVIRDKSMLNQRFYVQVSLWTCCISFTNQQFDEVHILLELAQVLTEWPHRMDKLNPAISLLKYMISCPWRRVVKETTDPYLTTQPLTILKRCFLHGVLRTGTVIFPGTFFILNSLDGKTLTLLTVCARLLGSSYGQLQVSTSYNANELCELISVRQRLMQYLREQGCFARWASCIKGYLGWSHHSTII